MGLLKMFFFSTLVIISANCAATPSLSTGNVDRHRLVDGVYEGNHRKGAVSVIVEVTIENQKITGIDIIKHNNWRGQPAEALIPDRIITVQSTKVDAVSGATTSSYVIMNAVQNAVDKAIK